MKRVIVLKKNSDIIEKKVSGNIDINNILFDDIKHIVSESHFNKMESQCNWEFPDTNSDQIYDISLFGVKDGNAGQENKTELPTPEDTDLYFGDIIIIRSLDNKLVDFKKKDYLEFYEMACGGFESIDSSEDNSDILSTDTSDEEFIPSEVEELYNQSINNYSDNTSENDLSSVSSDVISDVPNDDLDNDLSDDNLSNDDLSDDEFSDIDSE